MSDMSRLSPRPPRAPDHERHDALLVAQFVAGDPLKPQQQAEAQRLIDGCSECAALVTDLPAVSRAVAQEPVPPRRRDFRLSPEQAHELRGNPITRFLRGLSMPRSRAFQPAAAGVLSIGLLFVVAGYAWPDGGTMTVQAEPNAVDLSSAAPAASALEAQPAPALIIEPEVDDAAPLAGAERAMSDREFAGSLAESQAGLAQEPVQKSEPQDEQTSLAAATADGEAAEAPLTEAYSNASEPQAAEVDAGTDTSQERRGADGDAAFEQQVQDVAADVLEASAEEAEGTGPAEGTGAAAVVGPAPGGEGPEGWLVPLGLVLALGGAGLLLLGWLTRRTRDPLAP